MELIENEEKIFKNIRNIPKSLNASRFMKMLFLFRPHNPSHNTVFLFIIHELQIFG